MALKIKCDVCGLTLQKPGALLFSPPVGRKCEKYHACVKCWERVVQHVIGKMMWWK